MSIIPKGTASHSSKFYLLHKLRNLTTWRRCDGLQEQQQRTLGILVTVTSKPITFARYLSWSKWRIWHGANGKAEPCRPLVFIIGAPAAAVFTNKRNNIHNFTLIQRFSTFSLKWNLLQQFWLLAQPHVTVMIRVGLSVMLHKVKQARPWDF